MKRNVKINTAKLLAGTLLVAGSISGGGYNRFS